VGKGALFAPCPPLLFELVGTRSLSSGAHSRDPLALPTYAPRDVISNSPPLIFAAALFLG
jgi:hypothetical protein